MTRTMRLSPLALLALTMAACANDGDNETNAEDTGAETTDGSATMTTTVSTTDSATDTNTTTASTTMTTATTMTTSETDSADTTDTDTGPPPGCVSADDETAPRMEVTGDVESDTTLTCDTVWVLTAPVFVRGATLTLEPGTNVVGANGSALIVDVDARIEAAGTADAPIIFTSAQPKGSRQRADWGGVVLLGQAITNLPNGVGDAEGFADPPQYGGNDAAHDCGTLQYVRVEWAGFELVMDSELNGITFYTCGTDTTVDHVQTHMGSDDAMEFFGGGFDAKYIVASGQADDALDADLGFVGTFQYVFVHQDPSEPDGNHGLEWSNGPDNFTAEPLTSPAIANLTFVGQGPAGNAMKSIGFNIKQGAQMQVYNSYFTNVSGAGATFQDQATLDVAEGGVVVQGTFWGDHAGFGHQGMGPYSWDDAMWGDFLLGQDGNMDGVDLALDLTWTAPNVKPAAGGPADGAGVTPGAGLEATSYVGAVDPNGDDWTHEGWINYAID